MGSLQATTRGVRDGHAPTPRRRAGRATRNPDPVLCSVSSPRLLFPTSARWLAGWFVGGRPCAMSLRLSPPLSAEMGDRTNTSLRISGDRWPLPPQMMRSVHIEQNTRVLHLSCALPLLLTPTGPAAWHTPCDSRDRRGQAGLSVASSYDTTDTVSQLELSSEPSCWPACWCKPQRPERHHLVFLGSIMLCRTLRMLWWFCRFPWEFSDSSHLGSPQYLPLSPLLDRPGVRHFRHPTHRALCSQFTLIFRIGLAFPPKLTTLSQAQDPFHASLARCIVFFFFFSFSQVRARPAQSSPCFGPSFPDSRGFSPDHGGYWIHR